MSDGNLKRFDIVYLGQVPVVHKSEGLNVLLCDTIKPLISQGICVCIHTTQRHKQAIFNALQGNGIDMGKLEIRAYPVQSIFLAFYDRLRFKRGGQRKKASLRSHLLKILLPGRANSLISLFSWCLDLTTLNFFIKLPLLFFIVLSLVCFTAFSLIVFSILIIPGIIYKFIKISLRATFQSIKSKASISSRADQIKGAVKNIKYLLRKFKINVIDSIYVKEQIRFSHAVNKNKAVKRLFFFTAFDGHAVATFNGLSVVVFPDLVTAVYPLRYIDSHNDLLLKEARIAIKNANALVCYSAFVRDEQLLRFFFEEVQGKLVEVIPQGYFQIKNKLQKDSKNLIAATLNDSRVWLVNYFSGLSREAPKVDFTQFNYIIYPTIDRPHKNTLTLVRAFAMVLRRKHRNIKLILTSPYLSQDVKNFIFENRLHYEVLMMPSVPITILDSLMQGASIMVHPSLAEGGDIFNFSRAASVGTPSLLADIPVVREMFERGNLKYDQYKKWIFDPLNPSVLAERIDQVLADPAIIAEEQLCAVQDLSSYGFEQMANNYYSLYERLC